MALVRICGVDDVAEGQVRRFEVDHRPLAVVNLGPEGFRVVDAICSHAHYFLDEGDVDVDLGTIECPKHGSTFDLDTGRPRTLPATQPVDVFDVKVDGADVLIEMQDTGDTHDTGVSDG
jgi:3-phenylpropionate/trans-cinnamate dioxygenase ferredoxin subunit